MSTRSTRTPSRRAVLFEGIHPAGLEMLRQVGFEARVVPGALAGEALHAAISGVDVIGIRSATHLTADVLREHAETLLAVGCFCIGTNQVDAVAAARTGVPVFNSPFSNTRSVAELTMAEVIALSRRLVDQSAQMHRGVWNKSAAGNREVRGKTLGIVGYGHIGSQVSVLAEGLGMRVLFFDIIPRLALGNARAAQSLRQLLQESDAVTLHVPATAATKGMIGEPQLGLMKPGALLINNARGSVVDVAALAGAIRQGRIGGAALDVFPDEPAHNAEEFKSELRGLPNVILTPHVGGSTEEAQAAIAEDVARKLIRFVHGGTTTGAVNVPEVELAEAHGIDATPDGGAVDAGSQAREASDSSARLRILHFHNNVPGVLSKMHAVIAMLGANITAEQLQTRGDVGYVVLEVDRAAGDKLVEELARIPETIRVRAI